MGFVYVLCGAVAAGSCPALALAAISLLSQSLDRASTLSIWDAMRPSFLVYSSWQAKPCVMHGRGRQRFLGSGTEARAGLSRGARWLPCRAPAWGAGPAAPLLFPPEHCRASHLAFRSLGSQHVCYLSSAW